MYFAGIRIEKYHTWIKKYSSCNSLTGYICKIKVRENTDLFQPY